MKKFTEDQTEALDLMANLMESNARFNANLINSLMEGYERSAVKAETELRLVRMQMDELYASGCAPSERRIFEALYPDSEQVDNITEAIMTKRISQRGW